MRRIILASASPRRRELLEQAGAAFEVRPGNGEEVIPSQDPETVVKELSRQESASGSLSGGRGNGDPGSGHDRCLCGKNTRQAQRQGRCGKNFEHAPGEYAPGIYRG